ncbi:hypothetical protein R5R35_005441 [Gryllus longicercus]|uniref:Uncharacterized protein n=1 Tax=Gryllus longicercus TaxID=2509291 RepID=A0AAN9VSW6_9ORTH
MRRNQSRDNIGKTSAASGLAISSASHPPPSVSPAPTSSAPDFPVPPLSCQLSSASTPHTPPSMLLSRTPPPHPPLASATASSAAAAAKRINARANYQLLHITGDYRGLSCAPLASTPRPEPPPSPRPAPPAFASPPPPVRQPLPTPEPRDPSVAPTRPPHHWRSGRPAGIHRGRTHLSKRRSKVILFV